MNVHAIAEKYHLTVGKVRQMEKDGVLICADEGDHPLAASMRTNLANKQPLSVLQLVALIENPKVYAELRTRQNEAKMQVSAIGKYMEGLIDPALYGVVRDASENEAGAVDTVASWIKSIIPDHPVPHAYLAVRAIYGIKNAIARAEFLTAFNRALINCRKGGYLDGFYEVEQTKSRKITIYQNNLLDL